MALKDIGLGLATGGISTVAGGLFGKKKTPRLNTDPLNRLANDQYGQSAANIGQLRPETEKQLGQYGSAVDTAKTGLSSGLAEAISGYRNRIDPLNSAIVSNRSDDLRRQIADAQTAATAQSRELGAAGPGFGSGATRAALASIPLNFGAQLSSGLSGIQNTALQNSLAAEGDIYGTQTGLANTLFGTDVNTAGTGLNTRQAALGSEISGLDKAIADKYSSLANIEMAGQGFGIQNDINSNNSRDALLGNLIQLGGTVGGMALAGPAGAAGGSSLASLLAQQQQQKQAANYQTTLQNTGGYQAANQPGIRTNAGFRRG
jgi:hypothetical protein